MIALILAASTVVIIDPPQPLRCDMPGYRVVLASGQTFLARSASYLPSGQGIVIVPAGQGCIFGNGFEQALA